MPFISINSMDKPTPKSVSVGGVLLRAIFLFGLGLVMLGFVLTSLLFYHENKKSDHMHFTTKIDPIVTGATRPNDQLF